MTDQTNKKNAQNRAILAEIIDLSVDAVISVDGKHHIVWVNAAFEKIFGYREDEILGRPLDILLPEHVRSLHGSHMEAYDKSGDISRIMSERDGLFGQTKAGKEIPLDISILKHPEGSPCRYTATCRDISSRVAREGQVRESEAKFSKLFNSSHHSTILMDGNGDVLDYNITAKQLLHGMQEKFIGRKIWDCDFWADEVDFSLIREAMSKVKPEKDRMIVINALDINNRCITLEVTLKVIWMEHKHASRIILEAKDITDLVRSNKALMESKSRLARAQKIARLGNWEWKIVSNEVIYSDEVYNIMGVAHTQSGLTYETFMERVHPEDRERVEAAIVDALKGTAPYHIINRITLPDGTEKMVEQWGEFHRLEDGYAVRMDGTIQDITEHWQREQDLITAKARAEDANIAKAQFLAAISHELRTPLNAIIGFSTMIAEEHVGKINVPFYRDYAVDINNSGKELLTLIQNMLQVTSFELGSVEFQPCQMTAESILDIVMPVMSTRAADKNIRLEVSLADNIPELYLDQAHIRQILVHLVDNAIKFSMAGDIVRINLDYHDNEFIMKVSDQGIGLDDKDKSAIFDLFVQKDMDLSRVYGGVGLGLTIVKRLAEIQGGRVHVESGAGQGSCFCVCFPDAGGKNARAIDIGHTA